jgi:phosphoglycolate phosphatase
MIVGFDLDMTLIDSRAGIAAAYRALTARTGVHVEPPPR